jgi:hypothetical protein
MRPLIRMTSSKDMDAEDEGREDKKTVTELLYGAALEA